MSNLTKQKCVACRADAPRVTDDELPDLIREIPDWQPITAESVLQLSRVFNFKDYSSSLDFANKVAELAEEEDHHPAILLEWGKVGVTWWTHKIGGLHKNDFIAAAKTDLIYSAN
jgi:4a-hydroxytetrahydrobiopterin dehydratase